MIRAIVLLALALAAGCATPPAEDQRDVAFEQHLRSLETQIAGKKTTRRDAAVSARDKSRELGIADPYTEEVWAYRIMLAGQVERDEITTDRAAYLDQQKVNEIVERAQVAASRANASRGFVCRPDPLGGVRCR